MADVSINILNSINLNNVTTSTWLHKINLEIKCKQSKVIKCNKVSIICILYKIYL